MLAEARMFLISIHIKKIEKKINSTAFTQSL